MAPRDSTARRRADALGRLSDWYALQSGETDGDGKRDLATAMEGQPEVTPLLRRFVKGGIPVVIAALRAYDDEDAAEFLALYDSRSKPDRQLLPLEAVAVACGIGCARLRELALAAVATYNQDAVKLIITTGMPAVVETSMKQALKPLAGRDDRMAMLKAATVLPVPKGSQIQVNYPPAVIQEAPDAPELPQWDAEKELRALHEAQGMRTKELPPAHVPAPPEVVAIQEETAEALRE